MEIYQKKYLLIGEVLRINQVKISSNNQENYANFDIRLVVHGRRVVEIFHGAHPINCPTMRFSPRVIANFLQKVILP